MEQDPDDASYKLGYRVGFNNGICAGTVITGTFILLICILIKHFS